MKYSRAADIGSGLLLWGFILYGLYLISLSNYLLFHSLAELFSIVVACSVFLMAWNSRQYFANDYLIFVSIASLFVAGFDTLHMFAYKGMGVYQVKDANLPTQLWIAARYLQSLSFYAAPLFFRKTHNHKSIFIGFSLISALLLASLFYWNNFPDCYIEGVGLTRFKILSEYIISLFLLGSIVLLYYHRQRFEPIIFRYFILSIFALICAEISFTLYINIFSFTIFIGHIFKTISFIFLYQAIIVGGLKQPYNLLFRDQKISEIKLKKAYGDLELRVQLRTAELAEANQNLTQAYNETIEGWSLALELRDKETVGHTNRVTQMSLLLGQKMGMTEKELLQLRRGSLLHDIGKMGIPDAILLKPGHLTESELKIMQRHPEYAYDMLSPIIYLRPALVIPYCHHEKWDGTGYPNGLKGKSIPLAARLFAVVDVWDALRSNRPYNKPWNDDAVYKHLQALSGTHFDPEIVEEFLTLINEANL